MAKMIVAMVLAIVSCFVTNKGAAIWDNHDGFLWGTLAAFVFNIGSVFLQASVRYQWRERKADGVVMRCVAACVSAYCGYYVLVIGWHHWSGVWQSLFIGLVGVLNGGIAIGLAIALVAISLYSKFVARKLQRHEDEDGEMMTAEEFFKEEK